jgi:hypothetical protein
MASIFVSAATAAAVASAVAAPAVCLLLWRAWTYERLLLATLVATSNLFILHRAIALHSSTGDNIFGIRDVFLIAVLVTGFYRGRYQLLTAARHPLVWPGIAMVVLLPTASLLGLANGAKLLNVAKETFVFSMWLLPLVVAANVHSLSQFRAANKAFLVLGALIAVGTIQEVASFGALQLVSTLRQVELGGLLVRVFPDAWAFMVVACVASIIGILAGRNRLLQYGAFALVITAVVLTQQRGLLFSILGVIAILVALTAVSRHGELKARRVVVPAGVFLLVVAGLGMVAGQLNSGLSDWYLDRYKNIARDTTGRAYELTKVMEVFQSDPLAGIGLGARYRDVLPETDYTNTGGIDINDDGTFCHNFVGFCLVKLGLPGALAFFAFNLAVLQRFVRYSLGRCDPEVRRYGLALSTSMVIFLIMAQAANVFGDIRVLPICAIAAGLEAGLEMHLARSATGLDVERVLTPSGGRGVIGSRQVPAVGPLPLEG